MKNNYNVPKMEVLNIPACDIICTSGGSLSGMKTDVGGYNAVSVGNIDVSEL